MTKMADIKDCASNTFLCGEKNINPDWYSTGQDQGDDQYAICGFDSDINRVTGSALGLANRTGTDPTWLPYQDQPGVQNCYCFGSAHAVSFNMAMCDGSVRTVNYSIDRMTYLLLGDPADGLTIDAKKW